MKLFSRNKFLLIIFCAIAVTSCTNYGKKVTFPDSKGEVYYKGDGVTESDAKSVGKFLTDAGFFAKDDKTRSVQISKDSSRIKARFVVDEKSLAASTDADANFAIIGAALSKNVFNNIPVDVVYTDDKFKDIRTVAYKPEALDNIK